MPYLFNKPPTNRGLFGEIRAYLGGLRFLPNKKISEDFALEALGFLDATVLKTFLKDSTI